MGSKILVEMRKQRFLDDQIRNSLRVLSTKRLIETPHGHYRELAVEDVEHPEQFHFRATSVGVYHIRFWSTNFSFLDAVCTDTPIFNESYRVKVNALSTKIEDISLRHEKSLAFRQYLIGEWNAANFDVGYYDFNEFVKLQEFSFESVKKFIDDSAVRNLRSP